MSALFASPRHDYRPPLGFKVIPNSRSDGVQLLDFPNGSSLSRACRPLSRRDAVAPALGADIFRTAEILTQILSHLHPDSHGAVALVSKRFYALVTTPY